MFSTVQDMTFWLDCTFQIIVSLHFKLRSILERELADRQGSIHIAEISLCFFKYWRHLMFSSCQYDCQVCVSEQHNSFFIWESQSYQQHDSGLGMLSKYLKVLDCNPGVVVTLTVLILLTIFSAQKFGTDRVGAAFAPILLIWLLGIAGKLAYRLIQD